MNAPALPPRAVLGVGSMGLLMPILMLAIFIYVVTSEQQKFSGRGR